MNGPDAPIAPGSPSKGRTRGGCSGLVGKALLVLTALVALGAFWAHRQLRGSLPLTEGDVALPGLSESVLVERDELGVPTLQGSERRDLSRALGFVHAQERFFQMDLSRRQAAGELAELVGEAALGLDRKQRIHRFRDRSRGRLETLPPEVLSHVVAYAEGVNAGLAALAAVPFEYLVLGLEPEPWLPEDSLLVIFAMYFELHDEDGSRESSWGLLNDLLGPEMFAFLAPWGTEWDAPIVGGPLPTVPLPGPEVFDLRDDPTSVAPGGTETTPELKEERPAAVGIGSNNWAVAGPRTTHGGAILANDMHLGHSVPNIWFRASLAYPDPDAPERRRRITGVTLPGAPPVMITGSNGEIAWGFTNSYGDWVDLVELEPADGGTDRYKTPEGPREIEVRQEILRAKGGSEEVLEIPETIWGPVIDSDHRGRRRALRWTAHDPEAIGLDFLALEGAASVDEALTIAGRIGAPPQNFVVADRNGRIGWTIMGPMPRRFGHDGRLPTSWADGTRGWNGYLGADERPRVVDPPGGRIWTANARVVDGEALAAIGHGGYDLGARAGQIRDGLLALDRADERDLLAIQLDDRALFLERWRELLLATLEPDDPRHAELRELVESWSGRASVDSAGYRLVRAFRLFLRDQVYDALTAACEEADERFDHGEFQQAEGPLWRLVSERPAHLLNPLYSTWDEQLTRAVDATLDYFGDSPGPLADRTWGERNTSSIRHPLSRFVPLGALWLDMPATPLPGDANMPRVQGPSFGASERMVVSPGREAEGFFHMPTGQSGHPLSPHYGDGHDAWIRGEPTPFLPGETVTTLVLTPQDPG